MLTVGDLLELSEMPEWSDVSLKLYKEFTIKCLLPKTFRYYFVNGKKIDVEFRETAMRHLWAIHHIDGRIKRNKLFEKIDNGLELSNIARNKSMKRRLNDNRDRIKAFACVYHLLREGDVFFVECGKLKDTDIEIDYLKSKTISSKGVNLGMRSDDDVCVPITMLIDRAIDPNKTTRGLMEFYVAKMEVWEDGNIIEVRHYNYASKIKRRMNISKYCKCNNTVKTPKCFRTNTYPEKLKQIKLKNRR